MGVMMDPVGRMIAVQAMALENDLVFQFYEIHDPIGGGYLDAAAPGQMSLQE